MPIRPELRRRGALLAASLVCIALCAGCGEVHARTELGPARPLTVSIDGSPSGLYAALYTAAADGDFADGALAVTIRHPPGGDPLHSLAAGSAGVAIVSEAALLSARDRGAQVVAIGALVGQPLDGIVSVPPRQVTTAGALAGATVALAPTPLASAELETAVSSVQPPPAHVRRLVVAGDLAAPLRNRRATAALGGPWPVEVAELQLAERRTSVMQIQQAGVPTFAQLVIAVSVAEAHRDGPLLRAFLQSLTRGERATRADPGAAAAILVRADPRLNAGLERRVVALTLPLTVSPTPGEPFGYQDPFAWRAFGAWMLAHGLLHTRFDAGLLITDEFLPGAGA